MQISRNRWAVLVTDKGEPYLLGKLGHQRVLAHVEGVGSTWIRTYATKERAAAVAKRYHVPSYQGNFGLPVILRR